MQYILNNTPALFRVGGLFDIDMSVVWHRVYDPHMDISMHTWTYPINIDAHDDVEYIRDF